MVGIELHVAPYLHSNLSSKLQYLGNKFVHIISRTHRTLQPPYLQTQRYTNTLGMDGSSNKPAEKHRFTSPNETVECAGALFDMDGTIIDSTDAIVKHWHKIGAQLGVDPTVILATSHGRRSIDVLEHYDPKLANWECG